MASQSRRSTRDLSAELREDGPQFRFFQAVRLLALSQPENKGSVPRQLRFNTPLSLNFPASEIQTLREGGSGPTEAEDATAQTPPLHMTVGFMGLTGPSGVLPTAYTELLIARRHEYRDTTAHDFLDLFSHRALSLFYQAWRKHRFYLACESGEVDRFSRNLLDLVGVGLQKLQERLKSHGQGIPDRFLIHYAGLLAQKPVPASNIGALVSGYFGVDAVVEQFIGQWMNVPEAEQARLGMTSAELGSSAFLGERAWDRQTKIRVRIGPLSREQFAQLLPGQGGMVALRELTQFCVGHGLACDARLVLKKEEIQPPRLDGQTLQLGFNTWLNDKAPAQDSDDVQYTLLA